MKQKINAKKRLYITLCLSLLVIIAAAFFIFRDDKSIRYGYYEFVNQDGSISSIRLLKNSVTCNNLDFELNEWWTAIYLAEEQWKAEGRASPFDREDPDFAALRDAFLEQVDYNEVFDKKEVPISEITWGTEDKESCFISICDPQDSHYNLSMMYIGHSGILVFGADWFKYAGKEASR